MVARGGGGDPVEMASGGDSVEESAREIERKDRSQERLRGCLWFCEKIPNKPLIFLGIINLVLHLN